MTYYYNKIMLVIINRTDLHLFHFSSVIIGILSNRVDCLSLFQELILMHGGNEGIQNTSFPEGSVNSCQRMKTYKII